MYCQLNGFTVNSYQGLQVHSTLHPPTSTKDSPSKRRTQTHSWFFYKALGTMLDKAELKGRKMFKLKELQSLAWLDVHRWIDIWSMCGVSLFISTFVELECWKTFVHLQTVAFRKQFLSGGFTLIHLTCVDGGISTFFFSFSLLAEQNWPIIG